MLTFHLVGVVTWFALLAIAALFTPISTSKLNRQFNEAALIGAATWLVAAFLIVWLWRSGKPNKLTLWIPVAWWIPSFLFALTVIY